MTTNDMATPTLSRIDVQELQGKVQEMYRRVAHAPGGEFHFEMGRALAERLGYDPADLDAIPEEAVRSFAGVGYYFDLADLRAGEKVLDLGSGSGMDAFLAALEVGSSGQVIGIDMTADQLEKSERLTEGAGYLNVVFREGYLEELPIEDASVDCVISNGVINLCHDKARVFREVHRVLRPGGRLALADIVTEMELPEDVTCNTDLWAACIGGAAQLDRYRGYLRSAELRLERVRENTEYRFLSRSALGASRQYGVKSISLLATRPS